MTKEGKDRRRVTGNATGEKTSGSTTHGCRWSGEERWCEDGNERGVMKKPQRQGTVTGKNHTSGFSPTRRLLGVKTAHAARQRDRGAAGPTSVHSRCVFRRRECQAMCGNVKSKFLRKLDSCRQVDPRKVLFPYSMLSGTADTDGPRRGNRQRTSETRDC